MIRSLRKGTTLVELNHSWGTDAINAENSEIELRSNRATFRTWLKPKGENQKDDAERFSNDPEYGLQSVSVVDEKIRKELGTFLRSHSEIEELVLELVYDKSSVFKVKLAPLDDDGVIFNLQP